MKKMKKILLLIISGLIILSSCNNKESQVKLKSYNDSLSYVIGKDIGKKFERSGLDSLNIEYVAKGIKDYFSNDTSLFNEDALKKFLTDYSVKKRAEAEKKMIDDMKLKYKMNLDAGEKFLKENAKKEGVITTESGLQYKVLKSGNGNTPGVNDKVKVFYEGYTIDGKKFGGNYGKEPEIFEVSRVIKGWTEVLQLMKEGDEWEVYIPSDLAYSYKQAGDLKPFSVLIYKINLLEVIPKK